MATTMPATSPAISLSPEVQNLLEVPLFDKNEYSQFVLPNGILATLVSDPSLQR